MIERSPRAPVLRSMALAAMAFNASGSNSNLVSSRDNNFDIVSPRHSSVLLKFEPNHHSLIYQAQPLQ